LIWKTWGVISDRFAFTLAVLHASFSDLGGDKRAIDALWKMIQLFTFLNAKRDEHTKRTEGLLKDLKYYATASNQGLRRVDSSALLA